MRAASVFRTVARSSATAILLDRERRIVRTNEGWSSFARANSGEALLERWTRGVCIDDALGPLRAFYVTAFTRALETGEPWEHEYECHSPELHRRMRMRALPFDGDFLLVLHTPLVERPHDVPDLNPSSEFEPIRMCAHCRRVRSHDDAAWYWVPRYLQPHDVKISHGLCEPCAAYYPY